MGQSHEEPDTNVEMMAIYRELLIAEIGGRAAAADILRELRLQTPDLDRPLDLSNADRLADAVVRYADLLIEKSFAPK